MVTATLKARSLTPEENEEFLSQLGKGGELLAAGKVSEAKPHLERAHQLHPKNDKGQNLLGLTYFKLGIYDRAAEIYEKLVMDNPADPTLRVNLGLVYLKTNALQRAVREFETATDLAPEHKKSHNYLGLALAQAGEYARAKEHFILAGSEAMAEKMSRALAGEGFHTPTPPKAINGSGHALPPDSQDAASAPPAPAPLRLDHPVDENPVAQVLAEETDSGEEPPLEVQEDQEDWGFAETQHGTPGETDFSEGQGQEPAQLQGQDYQGEGQGQDPEPAQLQGQDYPGESQGVEEDDAAVAENSNVSPHLVEQHDTDLGTAALNAVDAQGAYEVSGLADPNVQTDDWGNQVVEYAHEMTDPSQEELRSEEVPIYDLATDAAILAPEENSGEGEGIRAGTGIHASFAPDPTEHTPPPEEDPYAHSAYVEPYDETNDPGLMQARQEVAHAVENGHGSAPYQHEYLSAGDGNSHPEPPPPDAPPPYYADEADAQLSALQNAEPHVDPTIFADIAGRSRLIPDNVRGPFDVKSDSVSVVVQGETLTRLAGLLAMTGQIELTPERKRFRGRVTDRNFGEGEEQVMRAKGAGVLVIENKGQLFQSTDLNDESAYFREDVVFAFEEPVVFENGNVPSDVAPDVQLVHLRGKGQVLLCLQGPLKSVPVKGGQSVTVPLSHLVGWYGSLSPKIIALVSDGKGKALKAGVELSGEGFVLIAVPLR